MFGPSPPPSPTTPLWASDWSPVTQVFLVMKKRIYLPKLVPLCPLMRSPALSPQLWPKSVILNAAIGGVTSPTPIWTSKSPKSLRRNFFFLAPFAVSIPVFAAMATVFFYLHIFTGSVGRRILFVVPVDTFYRTSIISSLSVLPLNPFVNLSLAPLYLFSIYGPDLGVWPDCWVSAEFFRAPIPRKGSGSTTTTTTGKFINRGSNKHFWECKNGRWLPSLRWFHPTFIKKKDRGVRTGVYELGGDT